MTTLGALSPFLFPSKTRGEERKAERQTDKTQGEETKREEEGVKRERM